MMSTIQQSTQNPSVYTSVRTGHSDDSSSPSRLVGGVRGVECPQPVFTSLQPVSLLCPSGRPAPSLDLRHGGGTYNEGALEFLSAEMNFSALYMHDIHSWRLNHARRTDYEDEHARQIWQTDSPTTVDAVSVMHHMPNIQEGNEDEETGAVGGQETDYLLSASSSQTPLV